MSHKNTIPQDAILEGGKDTDIVIPIMGTTGAGKSSFINTLLGDVRGSEHMEVGHQLTSCTINLRAVMLQPNRRFPRLQGRRVVIVDTPGFDDTYVGDVEILTRIAQWLEHSYRKKMVVGGVIYLHDISQDRFSGTARRNLEMFNHLCGDAALNKVILATTKWSRLPHENAEKRESEMASIHWKSMIAKGSELRRFVGGQESAYAITNVFLERASQRKREEITKLSVQIQKELVDDHKFIPQTEAGKHLRYTLEEFLKLQKKTVELEVVSARGGDIEAEERLREAVEKAEKLKAEIQTLKVSFPKQIRRWLSKMVSTFYKL